ncbi:ArsR/SmtB family transcription factor [Pontimicrobium aquaticum]|uniref:Helix-turn-helix transcriptional regulator n=1 Tax=Pontimicrobium aquaticum TaxID=2565367 RepID=A0A4U0EVS2_9FLAO|nr:helix-turn-helix domain-containing protein [Pontimicrobium aquaticum]TJY36047.1 helix-turn-helix transcriptional regulator [Pontimicrobium aquaticum]
MEVENQFSKIASLIGDKTRSIMLWSLLDGKAYTATELAVSANITRQSASNHLSKLMEAKLILVEKQGRHRYFRLANEKVAQVIESMASLILDEKIEIKKSAEAKKLAFARTCYDHLAGKLSVEIVTSLMEQKIITLNDNSFEITDYGKDWFVELGINVESLKNEKRSFAHKCLDWTERRHHIAGALGAAILKNFLEKDWIRRKQNTREVIVTSLGESMLSEKLKIMI